MANIDRIVKVSISLQTAAITSQTFSDLLLFGPFVPPAGSTAKVYVITDPDELVETYGVLVSEPMYLAALAFFSQIPHPPRLYIGHDANAVDVTTDLIALNDENSDWYGICDVLHDETRAVAIATWVEGHEKLFVTALSDPLNLSTAATDTTSTGALLKAGNFFRTAWWYSDDIENFPDVGICSKSFTKYPGQ